MIDCKVDRMRQSDWTPVLDALKCKNYLRMVAFRSFWQPNAGFENCEFKMPMKNFIGIIAFAVIKTPTRILSFFLIHTHTDIFFYYFF